MEENKVVGKECRFAVYCKPPQEGMPDLHVVKEITHYADKSKTSSLRLMYDFERPFWVVSKSYQNYEQPKEWIEKSKCLEYKTTQATMNQKMAVALNQRWLMDKPMSIKENPFLFGADIKSTAVIKGMYREKYPDFQSIGSIAFLDTETDVAHGTDQITLLTFLLDYKFHVYVNMDFHHDVKDLEKRVREKYINQINFELDKVTANEGEYLKKHERELMMRVFGELVKAGDASLVMYEVKNEEALLRESFANIHELKPDYMAIWNMDFEMTTFLASLERWGIRPEDIFCAPEVPENYRFFEYKRGKSQKVTASGLVTPIKPAARWHTVYVPASFYIVDAMCIYKHNRVGTQDMPSYSLDAILDHELKTSKLRFKTEEKVDEGTLTWHKLMQTKYKVEYAVYNIFDVLGMLLLEEKSKDIGVVFPKQSGTSDFDDYHSQPRRAVDELHWYVQKLDQPLVMGVTSKKLKSDWDEQVMPLGGWIVTLPAPQIANNGLNAIAENDKIITRIYLFVADLDAAASYPTGEVVFGISKETTRKEIIDIQGVAPEVYRMQNMQLTAGHVNAVEWCTSMLNYPSLADLLKLYDQSCRQNTIQASVQDVPLLTS